MAERGERKPQHILPFSNFLLRIAGHPHVEALGIMGLAAIMVVIGLLIIVLINLPAVQ
jgi:hypothetical protein